MNAHLSINPFLSGNFAPIHGEDDFDDLVLEGEIPRDLIGVLYRNGPNPQFEPRDPGHHWFAGDGMIHAFRVAEGKVSYRNRFSERRNGKSSMRPAALSSARSATR